METSISILSSSQHGLGFKLGFPQSALASGLQSVEPSRLGLGFSCLPSNEVLPHRGGKQRLYRKLHSRRRISSISAIDSNQHNTTDQSEPANKQESSTEGAIEPPASGLIKSRLEESSGVRTGLDKNTHESIEGLVLGLCQEEESWDSGVVASPVVRRYLSDNEERWFMWYSGKSAEAQVPGEGTEKSGHEVMGLSISSNGVHWKRSDGVTDVGDDGVGKVLDCSEDWWAFDTEKVAPSDVLVMSSLKGRVTAGVYWMYYTGGSSEEVEVQNPEMVPKNLPGFKYSDGNISVSRTRPGLTMSHDGRNWARIEGDHHSGALFDVGAANDWDSLFIASPHVVYFTAEDLRMYYHSFDLKSGCFSVGYARSRDGIKWVKFGKVLGGGLPGTFDELGVKCPQVVARPDGNGFLMVYEGIAADGRSSFGLARSIDGLSKWERCSTNPIFTTAASEDAWDGKEIHSPCFVHMDGDEWRLYYQGVDSNGRSGIGMAVCSDGKLQEFKRCHGLHL